jgi:hypothetical protein
LKFFEVSAKTALNVNEVFLHTTQRIIDGKPEKLKNNNNNVESIKMKDIHIGDGNISGCC